MSDTSRTRDLYTGSECWIARGIGLLVNSFFVIVLFQTLTDKNGVPLQLWPMVVCVAICMLGIFGALRWERAGGRIAIAGAAALVLANLCAALFTGLGWFGIVSALVYSVPFFLSGSLFVSGRRPTKK
jgi:hypothetical protein